MTDEEIVALTQGDSLLERARKEFRAQCDKLEKVDADGARPLNVHRMEFDAVRKIASILGVEL